MSRRFLGREVTKEKHVVNKFGRLQPNLVNVTLDDGGNVTVDRDLYERGLTGKVFRGARPVKAGNGGD